MQDITQTKASTEMPTRRIISWHRLWRFVLAGPLVALLSLIIMATGSFWLPPGDAQVNHLAIPVVLLPTIWAALFFYCCLDRLARASAVMAALFAIHIALITHHFFTFNGV